MDVPHLRSMESSIAADFDVVVGRAMAGDKPLVVRGFTLANTTTGTSSSSLQLLSADSVVFNLNASEAGSFLWIPSDRAADVLNSANSKVTGSFASNSVNYVGIDFIRTADATTKDLVKFYDPDSSLETERIVPLGRTLDFKIVISAVPFSSSPNLIPIAKVTTDTSNNVTVVQDARPMMFRLGSGGDVPNAGSSFAWPFGRQENSSLTAFTAGDKSLISNKDWMDAIMTRVWEIGGGENWYSPTSDKNVKLVRYPAPTVFSNGDNFEIDTGFLHWKGLRVVFENSNTIGAYYNDIADSITNDVTLNTVTDGYCWYVDIDRTANKTGVNSIVMKRALMQGLSTPVTPGSRFIIAWATTVGAVLSVYTRDGYSFVGASFAAATTSSIGAVKLSRAASTPSAPIVIADTGGSIVNNAVARGLSVVAGNGNNPLTSSAIYAEGDVSGVADDVTAIVAQGRGGYVSGGPAYALLALAENSAAIRAQGSYASGAVLETVALVSGGSGLLSTGFGTGSGAKIYGGATGIGAEFFGGATSGSAISALAYGISNAISATGGSPAINLDAGAGIEAIGGDATGTGFGGNGGVFFGGANDGRGLSAIGGGTNGPGALIRGTGTGIGAEVSSISGVAARITGNATSDTLQITTAGTRTGIDLSSVGSSSAVAIKTGGYVQYTTPSNPAGSVGFTNTLTAKNICKAWFSGTTDGAGGFSTSESFNMTFTAASMSGNVMTFDIIDNISSANTMVVVAQAYSVATGVIVCVARRTSGGVITLTSQGALLTGVASNFTAWSSTANIEINIVVYGTQ